VKKPVKETRRAIIVLGMHRSGTSALARVINLAGIDLGNKFMPAKPNDNESGFWEHMDIFQANEKLLRDLNSSWDDVRPLPDDWWNSDTAKTYKLEIISILERDFADSPFWGVKDPRISRFLPLWIPLLDEINSKPFFVFVVRNPLEVVASLVKRNSFPKGKSCLLWLRHLIEAEKGTRNLSRAFVIYEELLSDWQGIITTMGKGFGFRWPVALEKINSDVELFLQDNLHHNRITDDVLIKDKTLSKWIRDAYVAVKNAVDGNDTNLIKTVDSIQTEMEEVDTLYISALTELWDRCRINNAALQDQNQHVDRLSTRLEEFHQTRGYNIATIEQLQNVVKERDQRIEQMVGELAHLQNEFTASQEAVSAHESEVNSLQTDIKERDERIQQLVSEVTDLRDKYSSFQGLVAERESEVNKLKAFLRQRDSRIEQLNSEMGDLRDVFSASRGTIAEREWELNKLNSAMKGKDEQILQLNAEKVNLQGEIDSLQMQVSSYRLDMEAILNSTSWKLTAPLRWISVSARGFKHKLKTARYLFNRQYWIIKKSALFDVAYYLEKNPDVAQARINPIVHYLKFGAKEERDPHPLFDSSFYLAQNPDVAETGTNPLAHFIKFGANEGREPKSFNGQYKLIKTSPLFDTKYYLEQNPDLAKSGLDPVAHYLEVGASEGKNPHPLFDTSFYLLKNPDVEKAGMNPLVHFLEIGADEGREPKPWLSMMMTLNSHIGTTGDGINRAAKYIDDRLKRRLLTSFPRIGHLIYDQSRLLPPEPDTLRTVDIIVTCHNAIDDLKACFHQLSRTTTSINDLILIDDGSEPETAAYIRRFSRIHKTKYIRNEQAMGHPTGATQGLQISTGDLVIVLNADTLPTEGWADKILACANSDTKIGIVGVLASTASWQSVPRVFDDDGDWALNPIPADISLDQFGNLLERNSRKIYPKLPFINGFCFAIKRKLMDDIGLFDYKAFPHYGEENDYCLRAGKRGWYGTVADNAYVYHKQGKGYTNERRRIYAKRADENLIAKHDAKLISSLAWSCRQSLKMAGLRMRSQAVIERFRLIREGVRKFGGRRLSFILPAVDGGGVTVILQEALAMSRMGVIVEILNLEAHREGFIKSNNIKNSPIKLRFFDTKGELLKYLQQSSDGIDAVVCSHHATPYWLTELDPSNLDFISAYYVQDYEPDFYPSGAKEHDFAKSSYTVIPDIKGITKTHWNKEMLQKETGFSATVIGPSVDIELFRPVREKNYFKGKDRVIIVAMVRPQTPRRAPEMTYKVLKTVAEHFPNQAQVYSFGCTDKELRECVGAPSIRVTHLGALDHKKVATVLGECDIFLDASTFQAMGLTALEAMACGCAVVVPQNGGTIDFAEDKVNSVVVDTTDYVLIVDKIADLIYKQDYREQLQIRAIEEATKYFPEKAAFNILSEIF
jgi:GT2 family glycosyltransferase